jgi:all-trans-8'-apo-beta-carotenal 15,15'-oxygenase
MGDPVATTETRPLRADAQPGDPHRIFEPLLDEHDYVIDEVEGRPPDGLTGTLYRNGPGKWEAGGQPLGHIFDGDGMLSMFAIDGEQVRYRNRYVRTNHYLGGLESRGAPERGIGTLKPGGILANALRMPANVANTSVVLHAGELLALWEGGNPHALDPDTLETLGRTNFNGGLRWLGAFSAHPKVDPLTGDLFNFGIEVFPRPMLRCYRVDPRGRLHHLRDVHIPEPVFNHDVALTARQDGLRDRPDHDRPAGPASSRARVAFLRPRPAVPREQGDHDRPGPARRR